MNQEFKPPLIADDVGMPVLILDPERAHRVREEFAKYPDRWDEVWDGVYVMAPVPNNEHQEIGGRVTAILCVWLDHDTFRVFPGCNVSDREAGWEHNYRCPDVAVYSAVNPAKDCGAHWRGGPDFLIEILSPGDRAYDKLPFYASVKSGEVLILGREPWKMELYRLQGAELRVVATLEFGSEGSIPSEALPVSFSFESGPERPFVRVTHSDGRTWLA
jgi:Uma2 family endonuclease